MQQRSKEQEEEDQDDPWGSLDKAFENLQDRSLYKQVYLKPPSKAPNASSLSTPESQPPKAASDPIAEMEEAIFAQAGAAAVQTNPKPVRNTTKASVPGVTFSDTLPAAGVNPSSAAFAGAGARWSEYMHEESGHDDDSPWSSLDAFVDNPDSSAQFAVPLQHLENQHQVMQQSAEQAGYPQQHRPAVDAFAANDNLLRQQMDMHSQSSSEEEAIFAQAGADAVARMFNSSLARPPASRMKTAADEEDSIRLSHIDPSSGGASMVDVGHKRATTRSATAVGRVYLPTHAASLVRSTESSSVGVSGKGPVLHTAQLAGIMAAKRTADLIPLCHPLALTHIDVKLAIVDGSEQEGEEGQSWISVECTARTTGPTGVEMEALTGCTVACLTVWDMVKAVAGKTMRIGEIMVVNKSGGKSGDWQRTA